MKRLVTLLLAAGLMFGATTFAAGSASAVELTAGGDWQFGWGWQDLTLFDENTDDRFVAVQRIRPDFKFTVDDNLSATLSFEIGTGDWGAGAWGMGADATSALKFRAGFVDWTVPGVDAKVRMGLQYAETPSLFAPVLAEQVAGIAASYDINDAVGLTFAWYRPYNGSAVAAFIDDDGDAWGKTSGLHDAVDAFLLSVPIKGDGWKLNPWGMYAALGQDVGLAFETEAAKGNTLGSELEALAGLLPATYISVDDLWPQKRGKAWWLGLTGELTLFDPLTVAAEFVYGSSDFGSATSASLGETFDLRRAGWMFAAQADYRLDFANLGLIGWYASGDDSNPNNGSERLPSIYGDSWGTNFGQDGGWYGCCNVAQNLAGTWGLGLRLDDISFVENLKHNLRVTYYQGTNNRAMAGIGDGTVYSSFYLTTGDSAWEFNFENSYQIYKNLTASFELGYIKFDFDEATWGSRDGFDDKMYKASFYLTYKF